jgi:hypothetical protein
MAQNRQSSKWQWRFRFLDFPFEAVSIGELEIVTKIAWYYHGRLCRGDGARFKVCERGFGSHVLVDVLLIDAA